MVMATCKAVGPHKTIQWDYSQYSRTTIGQTMLQYSVTVKCEAQAEDWVCSGGRAEKHFAVVYCGRLDKVLILLCNILL